MKYKESRLRLEGWTKGQKDKKQQTETHTVSNWDIINII